MGLFLPPCLLTPLLIKIQPLDASVYASFKSNLKTLMNSFNLMHPHAHITGHMLPKFASKAWLESCTNSNILSGFATRGTWPIDIDIFPDEAFLGAEVSDRPQPGFEVDEGIGSISEVTSAGPYEASSPAPPAVLPPPGLSTILPSPGPSCAFAAHSPAPSRPTTPPFSWSHMEITLESVSNFLKPPPRLDARGKKRVYASILTDDEVAITTHRKKVVKRKMKELKKTSVRGRPR